MDLVDRLKDIALHSSGFVTRVDAAMHSILAGHVPPHRATESLATDLCGKFALTAEVHGTGIVLYPLNTRAKQPPCITVSMASSQIISANGIACYRSAFSIIQVFDSGADDTEDADDLAAAGAAVGNRVTTKGRVLLV
jgi:hypothetical protein